MSVEGEQNTPEEEQIGYQEVTELTFDQVKRGSEILVFTGNNSEGIKEGPDYKIQVIGIRKNGLLVKVESATSGILPHDFTARISGSLKGAYPNTPAWNDTRNPGGIAEKELRVADSEVAYNLYMESLKDLEGNRLSTSLSTAPIRKLLFKQ